MKKVIFQMSLGSWMEEMPDIGHIHKISLSLTGMVVCW